MHQIIQCSYESKCPVMLLTSNKWWGFFNIELRCEQTFVWLYLNIHLFIYSFDLFDNSSALNPHQKKFFNNFSTTELTQNTVL